jgi:hypothetical protein
MLGVRMIVPLSVATREGASSLDCVPPIAGRDRCLSDIAFCLQALFFEMLATSDPRDPLLTKLGTLTVVHENTPLGCGMSSRRAGTRALPVYSRFALDHWSLLRA